MEHGKIGDEGIQTGANSLWNETGCAIGEWGGGSRLEEEVNCQDSECRCHIGRTIARETDDWAAERTTVLSEFTKLLAIVTGDGSKKRQAGEKPPWWRDGSHEAAIFSHLSKWKHGELVDKDSGAHPLVHLAWRALAIAYQETHGKVDPGGRDEK